MNIQRAGEMKFRTKSRDERSISGSGKAYQPACPGGRNAKFVRQTPRPR
ncbi:hypothetical protein RSSM_03769 [Rhodopirellula sallentina SM41]|uniref:Uncharacterized protein n=1 Tax=Rhodopirellula sallentina SM41 TaxID=1263870 RepID=M5U023_9BACT|nr:hypothetical protein RSSM_03769 [Rhodopirellula sallentina SM41]